MKRIIDIEEWNEFYKELTSNLEPYDHYDTGWGDAVDRIDSWMEAQSLVNDDIDLTIEEHKS